MGAMGEVTGQRQREGLFLLGNGGMIQRSIGICLGEASLGPGHYIIQNIPFYFQRLSCNIFKTHLAQIIIIIMP